MTTIDTLVDQAGRAADSMLQFAGGKEPDAPATSNVKSLTNIGTLLKQMAVTTRTQHTRNAELVAAMERIASLKVRGATELMERGDWKKLAAELQAIAQDCLGRT